MYFLSLWLSFAFSRTFLLRLSPLLHNSISLSTRSLTYSGFSKLESPPEFLSRRFFLLRHALFTDISQSLEQCLADISHSVIICRMNLSVLHRYTSQNGCLYTSLLLSPLDFSLLITPFNLGFSPHNPTETSLVNMTSEFYVVTPNGHFADFKFLLSLGLSTVYHSFLIEMFTFSASVAPQSQACRFAPTSLASSSHTSFMTSLPVHIGVPWNLDLALFSFYMFTLSDFV